MEKKVTYNEAAFITRIASAIPIAIDGRQLPQDTAASVIMAQVGWSAVMQEYESRMGEALKKMKKEGFDDRHRAYAEMERTDIRVKAHEDWDGEGEQPAMPTDEEIAAADKTRETAEGFRKELDELEGLYKTAREKEGEKTAAKTPAALTRRELADIIGMLGTEGTVKMAVGVDENGQPRMADVPRLTLVSMIAANMVE